MSDTQARDDICQLGIDLFSRGLAHGTTGNISVRLSASQGGGFLITPTDARLDKLDPRLLARLNDDGVQVSGSPGSKSSVLHRRIYEATRRVGHPARCIIHTHSSHLVALSLLAPDAAVAAGELLPALTPYQVMKVGRIPRLPYFCPGSPDAAEAVVKAISTYAERDIHLHAVMLDRLGPNVWHDSLPQAMCVLEELEETARLYLTTGRDAPPLDAPSIAELKRTFGASW